MIITDKVIELRTKNPRMPAIEIANQIGVSREYVRQILVKLGLPTRFIQSSRLCRNCGAKINKQSISGLCFKCLRESHRATLTCDECGKEYKVLRSVVRAMAKRGYKHNFCGRPCLNRYASRTYW